jgi:hypothetical protein
MQLFRLLGAATIFSVLAMPAMAQAVIYEPGYCAFYYPNANCQNKGPGNPYTGDSWMRRNQSGPLAGDPKPVGVVKKRAHRSRTSMQ